MTFKFDFSLILKSKNLEKHLNFSGFLKDIEDGWDLLMNKCKKETLKNRNLVTWVTFRSVFMHLGSLPQKRIEYKLLEKRPEKYWRSAVCTAVKPVCKVWILSDTYGPFFSQSVM